ncbi:hypothetical protein [Brevundimonas faecalis]|uniref:Uncharacterized protein n=1 Tax=Brevundimonas faecalis TaxID=947378 RepID=A0ABV2R811_9CAUL
MNLDAILSTLSGQQVSAKTIPGNTLEVWLGAPPQSDHALVLAVHPPWRLVQIDGVVATSAEIPWDREVGESDADYRTRNDVARGASDILIGRTVTSAYYDSATDDLTIRFNDDLTLQSFTVWRDEPPWTLRLYAENRRVGPNLDEAIEPPPG